MNTKRRERIEEARKLCNSALAILEEASSEERDYYDNMPESLQGSERGQRAEVAADALQDSVDDLNEIDSRLDTAVE